jgi:hypothetical protein
MVAAIDRDRQRRSSPAAQPGCYFVRPVSGSTGHEAGELLDTDHGEASDVVVGCIRATFTTLTAGVPSSVVVRPCPQYTGFVAVQASQQPPLQAVALHVGGVDTEELAHRVDLVAAITRRLSRLSVLSRDWFAIRSVPRGTGAASEDEGVHDRRC